MSTLSLALRRGARTLLCGLFCLALVSAGFFLIDFRGAPTARERAIERERVERVLGVRKSIEDRVEAIVRAFTAALEIIEEKNPGNPVIPPVREDLLRKRGQIDRLLDDLEKIMKESMQ